MITLPFISSTISIASFSNMNREYLAVHWGIIGDIEKAIKFITYEIHLNQF